MSKQFIVLAALTLVARAALAAPAAPASKPATMRSWNVDATNVPTPEEERAGFEVAEGFEVNLFAANPIISKPIEMNFDAAGRLWLVCSEIYPQIKPGQEANDKVVILEDKAGRGVADTATVFADGLLIPTGIEVGDGGCYVANSTELVHFKDTDGDGKADQRTVVLSGFGTEDTHHLLHTLRYGPDGRLYMNQSVYIHSHIETPRGPRRLNGGGIWRFDPHSMELGVVIRGLWNPWGHAWDYWGQEFATDGAGSEGVNYVLPGATYASSPYPNKLLPGLNPGSPKYASAEFITGRQFPDDWQGQLITNDFRASRVCRFQITEDGAGYSAKQLGDLIKSANRVFRPIDVKMGPDGALYIADWCNPIINHGEVDFRDPRRDHVHGRIWRVTAKNRALAPRPALVGASIKDLLEQLKAPEQWTRHEAKRVLGERDPAEVAAATDAWVKALNQNDANVEHLRLEALWTFETVNAVRPELLAQLLDAKDPHARAAAVRTVSHWHDQLPRAAEWLAARARDPFARVRLEAVRALAEIPTVDSARAALDALDQPRDRFVDYAVWTTLNELKPVWQPAYEAKQLPLDGQKLSFALQAVGSAEALRPMLDQLRAGYISPQDKAFLLDQAAAAGSNEDLGVLLDIGLRDATPAALRAQIFAAIEQAAKQRKAARPAGNLQRMKKVLADPDPACRAAGLRLAGTLKLEPFRPDITAIAAADATPAAVRQAAMDAIAGLGGPASQKALAGLAAAPHSPGVRAAAVAALASIDARAAAPLAAEVLAGTPTDEATGIYNAFLQRNGGDAALAAALQGRKLSADAAKLGMRALASASRTDSPLYPVLADAAGPAAEQQQLNREQMTALLAEVAKAGDPARGQEVFRRKELACLQCHAIGGAGGQLGPDLISLGASAPVDYIVDSILLPNKAVKEGFGSLIVTTKGNEIITGIKVRQTDKELVLRDALRDAIVIPLDQIAKQRDGGSIMPAGLADQLTHMEFVDLVRFLSELGKSQSYSIGTAAAVRRWRVLDPVPEAIARESSPAALAAALDAGAGLVWQPAYADVGGTLPPAALPAGTPVAIVRAQLEVTTAGAVTLKLNSTAGLQMMLDGAPVEVKPETPLDLARGTRTLTFVLRRADRPEGLGVTIAEVPGSAAKVQPVGGK